VAVDGKPYVGKRVTDRHPVRRQVARQARQQLLERLLPAGQQAVDVLALRNAPAWFCSIWQPVALDHDDGGETLRQNSSREQAGHAATENDGAVSQISSHDRHLLPNKLLPDPGRPGSLSGLGCGLGHGRSLDGLGCRHQ